MLSQLSKGIDLSLPILPEALAGASGVSHAEPWGRWTDGPVAVFQFPHALPVPASVEIDIAHLYPANREGRLSVRMGSATREVAIPPGRGTVHVELAPSEPATSVEVRIPDPASPKSRGESQDERLLGIGMKALRITEASPGSDIERMMRGLADGVDLSAPTLPAFLRAEGLSHAEPAGRWTDGPVSRIRLAAPLPARFTLELVVAHVFEPNHGLPIRVEVGGVKREFTPQRENESVRLDFRIARPADTIEIHIPKPTSPAELGASTDARRLGIRLKQMRIVAGAPG
jgi:hypothetical protein